MTKNILMVLIGGGTGSVLRYLASLLTSKFFPTTFPLATFLVNIIGCLIIGVVTGLYLKNNISNPDTKLLMVTGFCGGFTTFSTFAQENVSLLQANNITIAIIYTGLSVILGLTFVWLGLFITK
ncbi:MAG: fluoride efflux transporter CrcB [Sphingobacteriia bacterium]|jgi:CrcB protein|nr:fluoride efflux transporter CrcB [Sphingobacteriia bacterium]